MIKKLSIVILSITIIILISGVCVYASTFLAGDTEFNMPEGYYLGTPNENNALNITNGINSVFISEREDSNAFRYANSYKESHSSNDHPITIRNYTVGDTVVYKTDRGLGNNDKIHYWFAKNNRTYDVYVWEKNDNIENIVEDFIRS